MIPDIHVIEPLPFAGRSHSETCYKICGPWRDKTEKLHVHTSIADRDDPYRVLRPLIPRVLPRALQYRTASFFGTSAVADRVGRKAIARLKPGDICYFWPNTHAGLVSAAHAKGAFVVLEFINTHTGFAYQRLNTEMRLAGVPEISAAVTEDEVAKEENRLRWAHAVFCPGPFVSASIAEQSPHSPIMMETSYGVDYPAELPKRTREGKKLRFIFVGIFGVRKGARALLEAWEAANLDAELHIFGFVEDRFKPDVERLGSKGVVFRGYTRDIAAEYLEADVFVFPSLEEGGPQVTYEAAAHGLPLIVTRMGGGHVANSENALFAEDGDPATLKRAIQKMAEAPELRRSMGEAARRDARYFDWKAVSYRRFDLLMDAYAGFRP